MFTSFRPIGGMWVDENFHITALHFYIQLTLHPSCIGGRIKQNILCADLCVYLCVRCVCHLNDFLWQTGLQPLQMFPVGNEELEYVTGCMSHCFVPKLDEQTNNRAKQDLVNDAKDLSPLIISRTNTHNILMYFSVTMYNVILLNCQKKINFVYFHATKLHIHH